MRHLKHNLIMAAGCLLPLLFIAVAPRLGVGSNWSLPIFIALMFACHALMPMHHRGSHKPSLKSSSPANFINVMKPVTIAFLLFTLLAGCSRKVYKNIESSYDKSANFKQYKTFAWLPAKDTGTAASVYAAMRRSTVNYFTHCMGERGYKADVANPDLLLQLVVKSVTKEVNDPLAPKPFNTNSVTVYGNPFLHPLSNPFHYQKPFTYKTFNYPVPNGKPKETYLRNSIQLNVIDRVQQKVVWSAIATANLYDTAYLQMNLHPVVYNLLKSYPVKPEHKHLAETYRDGKM